MGMIAYIFLTLLGGGILGALASARIDLMAWKFVRLAGLLATVLLVFVAVAFWLRPPLSASGVGALRGAQVVLSLAALFAMAVYCAAPMLAHGHKLLRLMAAGGAVCSIAATVLIDQVAGSFVTAATGLAAARSAAHALTAFLLGSVTVAWLLGHAYLTATRMTIAPLRQLSRFFAYAVGLRLIFVIVCVALAYTWAGDTVAGQFRSAWMVLFLRGVAGLLVTGLFAYMVGECVKLRNTQAATGLLYFASVLVYIGEISAQYLMSEWRWPL